MSNSRLVELAIKGLEAEKASIEEEIALIRNQLTGRGERTRTPAPESQGQSSAPAAKPRRRMSAAARRKISEAMKRSHALRKAKAAAKK